VAHIGSVWTVTYFPSQDGSSHVYGAYLLRSLGDPALPALDTYFQINAYPHPNWLGHLVLAGLMALVPPTTAEKLLLSAYFLGFPLVVRYALTGVRADAEWLAVAAFPFAGSVVLHLGFYNYCLSLLLFFLVLGFWLHHRSRWTIGSLAVLALLAVLLYFSHIVSLITAFLAMAIVLAWELACRLAARRNRSGVAGAFVLAFLRRDVLPLAVALLPAAVLAFHYLLTSTSVEPSPTSNGMLQKLMELLSLSSLVTFNFDELWFSRLLAAALLLLTAAAVAGRWRRCRTVRLGDGFLLLAAFFAALYFFIPDRMAGGGMLTLRLLLLPYFALLLWLAAHRAGALVRAAGQVAATAAAIGLLFLHAEKYQEFQGYYEEYLSAGEHVRANTTVLALVFSHAGAEAQGEPLSERFQPLLHVSGYLCALRGAVDLANYEAAESFFPIEFRPRFHTRGMVHQIDTMPPIVDFLAYAERTGRDIDYVLLQGLGEERMREPDLQPVFRQLEPAYDLTFVSSPRRFVRLYRLRTGLGRPPATG
jgi:hypothetical protein